MKSTKSSGFKARKRVMKRPLARTGKHKKSAPAVRNVASVAAGGEKGVKKAIFEECAALAREKQETAAADAAAAADAMEEAA